MQPQSADLNVALAFVIERITQEEERSPAPLDVDEVRGPAHTSLK